MNCAISGSSGGNQQEASECLVENAGTGTEAGLSGEDMQKDKVLFIGVHVIGQNVVRCFHSQNAEASPLFNE